MVLGVDPSLRCTGVARTFENRVTHFTEIGTGRITTETTDSWTDVRERVRYIVGGVLKFAPPAGDCLTVIEEPFVPRHMSGSIIARAWLFGLLVDQLMVRGPVIVVDNRNRAKYAAESANASKELVLERMSSRFPGLRIADHNEADALALMAMGARWLGRPVDGQPSKKQMEAIRAVHWPIEGEH